MSKVEKLVERTVETIRSKGYEPWTINDIIIGNDKMPAPVTIGVREPFSFNKAWTVENVTCTIEVIKWEGRCGKRILKVKVPENASDKVLNSRVEKVIATYKEECNK